MSTTVAIAAEGDELHWAIRAGGESTDRGFGIATDGSGNTLVTGFFEGTATFGAGDPNEVDLTSADGEDIFVAKYDPTGALLWARSAGGASDDEGRGIATDGSGNSLVTGRFEGTATFGESQAKKTELTSDGYADIFIAKYDPQWRPAVGQESRRDRSPIW